MVLGVGLLVAAGLRPRGHQKISGGVRVVQEEGEHLGIMGFGPGYGGPFFQGAVYGLGVCFLVEVPGDVLHLIVAGFRVELDRLGIGVDEGAVGVGLPEDDVAVLVLVGLLHVLGEVDVSEVYDYNGDVGFYININIASANVQFGGFNWAFLEQFLDHADVVAADHN